jgi:hypothetical protein
MMKTTQKNFSKEFPEFLTLPSPKMIEWMRHQEQERQDYYNSVMAQLENSAPVPEPINEFRQFMEEMRNTLPGGMLKKSIHLGQMLKKIRLVLGFKC